MRIPITLISITWWSKINVHDRFNHLIALHKLQKICSHFSNLSNYAFMKWTLVMIMMLCDTLWYERNTTSDKKIFDRESLILRKFLVCINRLHSSDGRALTCKGGGPGFDSRSRQHSFFLIGDKISKFN